MNEHGAERRTAVLTSAVRDASNGDEFLEAVRAEYGLDADTLSGDEEARLTFRGATASRGVETPVLVVDIGGGSTELVVGTHEPEGLVSLEIGCVRMFEKHLGSDPPTQDELGALRGEVDGALAEAKAELEVPAGTRLVGVAGTVTQLAALKAGIPVHDPDVTHHAVLTHGDVRRLARRLESLPYDARRRVKGLEPGRVDVIIAGVEILLAVLEAFDAPEVLSSEKDILDGLVLQIFEGDEGGTLAR